MVLWNPRQTSFKPIWSLARLFINILIYYNMFKEPGFIDQLCGPLAIPASPGLFHKVMYVEVTAFLWPILLYIWASISIINNRLWRLIEINFPKALFLFVIKLSLIFAQEQRIKYYIHSFILEILILVLTGAVDLISMPKLAQAWQIIVLDSLQRITIFYEVTRTFCPNFAIYWFVINLLLLSLSQMQAHLFYYFPNSERMDAIYPGSLYVKQDIYRITIMTFVYFGMFSILQAGTYGYGMAVVFLLAAFPLLNCIKKVQAGEYLKSMISLIVVFGIFGGLLCLRVSQPQIFKVFEPRPHGVCKIFDRQ